MDVREGPPKPDPMRGGPFVVEQAKLATMKSGSFTVEEATYGRTQPGRVVGYWIKLEDGRRGWIENELYMAESEATRKLKVAEKAECDRKGGVSIGMSKAQVLASCWGKPERVNTTITAGLRSEQWVYGYNYVYLRDDVVTSIQTSSR
jgi:hypothetical protein